MSMDLTKHCGRSVLSISSENGERDIYCNALLIASFPIFCGVEGSPLSLTTTRWGDGPLLPTFRGGDSTLLYLLGGKIDLSLYL